MTEVTLSIKKNSVKKALAFALAFVLALVSVRVDVFAESVGKLLAAAPEQLFSTPGNGTTAGDGTLDRGYGTHYFTWVSDGSACTVTFSDNGLAKTIDCVVERATITAPTCTVAGLDLCIATATYGGNRYYIDKIQVLTAPLQHNFNTVVTKATATADGSKVKTCLTCGAQEKETYYKASSISLSKTSYTYNGKIKTPSVTVKDSKGKKISSSNYTVSYCDNKKVGTATVTVKFKGAKYKGSVDVDYVINPAATSITKVTAKEGAFKINWKKKTTQTTGYEIRYSTSSKFTSTKTKSYFVEKNTTGGKTISGLQSGKKYYVQIRTYQVVDDQEYYSEWSDVKTVTTK